MTRNRRTIVALGILVGCTALLAGCRALIADQARTSLADFVGNVFTDAVNATILPDGG